MAAPYQYPQYQQPQYQQPQTQDYSGYNPHYPSQAYPPQQNQSQAQTQSPQYQTHQYPQPQAQQQYSQQYPQQYPQQYQPSQYPQQYPQQYSQQYQAPTQQSYQVSQPSYSQPVHQPQSNPQPQPQSCFNCGVPGHWAQDCPEPKREVPAGALNPQQHRRQGIAPHKRNHQIVTKFGSHGGYNRGSPQGYGPPYSAGAYPQYPSPYTPGTPHSAPATAQPWPSHPQHHQGQHQQPQYPQYQQTAPNNQYYQAGPPTPQQSYPTPATPISTQPYAPSYPAQASPPASHYSYDPHSQQGQHPPAQSWHQSPAPSQQYSSQPVNAASSPIDAQQSHKGGEETSASLHTQSESQSAELEEGEEVESEGDLEDDLDTLDIPDMPQSTLQYGDAVVPPIAMPLPANFVVADTLAPFPRASAEDGNRCHSKYLQDKIDGDLLQNIASTNHFKDLKEDVIFLSIPCNEEFIPVADCLSKIKERQVPQEERQRDSRSASRSLAPQRKDVAECAETLQQLERALAEAKAKHAELVSKRQAEMERKRKNKDRSSSHDHKVIKQEDVKVKVEQMSPSQYSSVEPNSASQGRPENEFESSSAAGSGKPFRPVPHSTSHSSPPNGEAASYGKQSSGIDANVTNPFTPRRDSHRSQQHADNHSPNADNGSPLSAGIDPYGYGTNQTDNGSGYFPYQSEQSYYSARYRSDHSGGRKRNYEESSDDSDAPARRQEDDVTPKLKRRQPKVAEAYSRRW